MNFSSQIWNRKQKDQDTRNLKTIALILTYATEIIEEKGAVVKQEKKAACCQKWSCKTLAFSVWVGNYGWKKIEVLAEDLRFL